MLFLLRLTTVLSTVSALVLREPKTSDAGNKDLRILPLGASITYGLQSSNGNGYREDLRNLLSPILVTYVGSQCSGSMINGNNEGHPGFVIPQMESMATPDLVDKPNVVLVYVGTNDMKYGDAEHAPDNMKNLVSFLIDSLPNALIVVSKLFLNADPVVQTRIETFNQNISGIEKLGNVLIADMSSALSASDLSSDGTHPNDGGYAKMAKIFDAVLVKAEQQGMISSPEKITEQLKICNGPVSTGSQTQSLMSMASPTQVNLGTKTPKPVESQSTTSAPSQIQSSDSTRTQPQSSTKSSVTLASKSSSTSVTLKGTTSTSNVTSKPKSTTSNSSKTSTQSTKSTKKGGKAMAHVTMLPSCQSCPTKESIPTAKVAITSLGPTLSVTFPLSSTIGVSAASSSPLSASQISSLPPVVTSDSIMSSALVSSSDETAGTAYSFTTPSDGSSTILTPTTLASATSGPLSSQESNTAEDGPGLQASSGSLAIAYTSMSNASNTPSITFSSGGPSAVKASFFGLTILTLSFLVIF